jgi:hypothetical protein
LVFKALLFIRYTGENAVFAFRRFARVCEILSHDREETVKMLQGSRFLQTQKMTWPRPRHRQIMSSARKQAIVSSLFGSAHQDTFCFMPRFENLRLKPHKGLQAADLIDLRQINVICGPNNSGKTTVLECIAFDCDYLSRRFSQLDTLL